MERQKSSKEPMKNFGRKQQSSWPDWKLLKCWELKLKLACYQIEEKALKKEMLGRTYKKNTLAVAELYSLCMEKERKLWLILEYGLEDRSAINNQNQMFQDYKLLLTLKLSLTLCIWLSKPRSSSLVVIISISEGRHALLSMLDDKSV